MSNASEKPLSDSYSYDVLPSFAGSPIDNETNGATHIDDDSSRFTRINESYGADNGFVMVGPILKYLSKTVHTLKLRFTDHAGHAILNKLEKKNTFSTEWLDGLRGIACVFVVFHHTDITFEFFMPPREGENLFFSYLRWFAGVSPICLWNAGPAMVAIFFIVSGFSISLGSLRHCHTRQQQKILTSLSSSVFRRWMRLYLPTLVVMFGDMLASYSGLYNGMGPMGRHRQPPKFDTLSLQLKDWSAHVWQLSDPLQSFQLLPPGVGYTPLYDPNIWTIPVEFRGSMIVFTTILALSCVRFRLLMLCAIFGFLLHNNHLLMAPFLGGTLLAEIHFCRQSWEADIKTMLQTELVPHQQPAEDLRQRCKSQMMNCARFLATTKGGDYLLNIFWILNFAVALYNLGSAQKKADLYGTLTSAMHVTLAISNSECLQAIFTTKKVRFLGKISFMLYLVHGVVIHTVGWYFWFSIAAPWFGNTTEWQHLVSTGLASLLILVIAASIAYGLSLTLDVWSNSFARVLLRKVTIRIN
ncbi:hypothetical protein BP6252_11073 [Coleophoma cylindrospora]|uniref:Acyltransferase 3 domain-containing protein n=1 Tax=Coleophoma cylindrospora TaxID=1849047 RepID=A0A3D8QPB9_9HELO|nr:hypothetical protein BP6252_11073 [Coleophoma cylindrospora]